tara:strand:+ start:16700 stop:17485 length:786 start_codon:yes stop_codon:yes gene_type:complete
MSKQNKVAIITGSASGIGKATALEFAKQSIHVVIADINLANAQQAAADIEAETSMKTIAVKMDVTNEDEVIAAFETASDTFGHIDMVISNAGIQTICEFVNFDYTKWQQMIDIHLNGSFLVAREGMRHMIKQGTGGSIVLVGSVHSYEASKNKAAYVTAKHALRGMNRAIAKEGAEHNIRCNLVAPGFVLTPLVKKQIPEQAQALGISEEDVIKNVMLGNTVDGEFTTEKDIADAILFFANFETNALTGQSMIASHGWHMA